MPRPKPLELRTEARKTNNEVIKQIIRLKSQNPSMSGADIARSVNRDRSSVIRTLKRYNMDTKRVDSYKQAKNELLNGIEERLLDNVTQDKIDKASLKDVAISYGVFFDKRQLQEGKATQITQLSDIVEMIDKEEKQKLIEIKPGEYQVKDDKTGI